MNGKRNQFNDKEINWDDDRSIYDNQDEESIKQDKKAKRQTGAEGPYEANKEQASMDVCF